MKDRMFSPKTRNKVRMSSISTPIKHYTEIYNQKNITRKNKIKGIQEIKEEIKLNMYS